MPPSISTSPAVHRPSLRGAAGKLTGECLLFLPARWQWGFLGAAALAAAVLLVGLQLASRVSLEQRAASEAKTAGGSASPAAVHGAVGNAEDEMDTIGRDALKLWGAWDGLSPVATQMMAQKPPARVTPALAAGRDEGLRGRIRERSTNAILDRTTSLHKAAGRHSAAAPSDPLARPQSLHRFDDVHSDGSLEHLEAEAAPFPYVRAIFSLHGLDHELTYEELLEFRKSVADAVDLSKYGNGDMRAVLGYESYHWVVFQVTCLCVGVIYFSIYP